MSDDPTQIDGPATEQAHPRLRLVVASEPPPPGTAPVTRPRTIGRLIAQTALIADSAVTRRQAPDTFPEGRGMAGRLLGRFR